MAKMLCAPCLFKGTKTPSVSTVKGYQTCQDHLSYDTPFFRDWESVQDPHKPAKGKGMGKKSGKNKHGDGGGDGLLSRATPMRTLRPVAKLREGKIDWYRIRSRADGSSEISIYDEIGFLAVTAKDFINDLNKVKSKSITLRLNSPGGEVFDGIAIYNALANHPATVDVHVDGLAASIASVIAMAGDTITMAASAQMMIHDGFGMVVGNAGDMRQTADLLDKVSDNIAGIYAARTHTDQSVWRDKMRQETWYTADEALAAGLADVVTPRKGEAKAHWDVSLFSPRNAALPVHHTATEDSPWDGPAAVAAMPNDDAVLRYCHAWQSPAAAATPHKEGDDDADDQKANYKFPHHRTKGGAANLSACRNGLARLSGADIPDGDRAGVKAHLQAHLDDASKKAQMQTQLGFDPDEFREAMRDAVHG